LDWHLIAASSLICIFAPRIIVAHASTNHFPLGSSTPNTYLHKILEMRAGVAALTGISALVIAGVALPITSIGLTLAIVDIEQVLARFSIAVDIKDLGLLDSVFSHDAIADFRDGSGVIQGREAIKDALRVGQATTVSQHYLSTITVDVDGQHGTAAARSYLAGAFFGKSERNQGTATNETLITYG
jgi:hypothetical protein